MLVRLGSTRPFLAWLEVSDDFPIYLMPSLKAARTETDSKCRFSFKKYFFFWFFSRIHRWEASRVSRWLATNRCPKSALEQPDQTRLVARPLPLAAVGRLWPRGGRFSNDLSRPQSIKFCSKILPEEDHPETAFLRDNPAGSVTGQLLLRLRLRYNGSLSTYLPQI